MHACRDTVRGGCSLVELTGGVLVEAWVVGNAVTREKSRLRENGSFFLFFFLLGGRRKKNV
jgi:hypothetical protein